MRKNSLVVSVCMLLLIIGCSKDDTPNSPEDNSFRGDINVDGISYQIADCVLFATYFTEGLAAFTIDQAKQEAATDINADGATLSVADFVYMTRVVIGDAWAYPKVKPPTTPVSVKYIVHSGDILEILDGVECGALRAIIQGDAHPSLLNTDMEMKYLYEPPYTWAFVYSLQGQHFSGDIMSFQGTLISLELATAEGAPVIPALQTASGVYPLEQNYPNPFGPGTVDTSITFLAAQATDYTVTISNVMAMEIGSIHGHTDAGVCIIDLDFSHYESGIYFYRVEAQGVEFTRKLLVMN